MVEAILKQFDVKKVKDAEALVDKIVRQLSELSRELEREEATTLGELKDTEGEEGLEDDRDDDSWVDEVEMMSEEEQDEYERSIRPVKMVLVTVSACPADMPYSPSPRFARSPSRLYTRPRSYCQHGAIYARNLACRRDSCHGTSVRGVIRHTTLAVMSVQYRKAIDRICALRGRGLRAYELSSREWEILGQLCEVLKVSARVLVVCVAVLTLWPNILVCTRHPQTSVPCNCTFPHSTLSALHQHHPLVTPHSSSCLLTPQCCHHAPHSDIQGGNLVLLKQDSQPREGHPCDGPHRQHIHRANSRREARLRYPLGPHRRQEDPQSLLQAVRSVCNVPDRPQ